MSEPAPLLVLGLGNVLLEDDGVGSAAVALLLDRYGRRGTCACSTAARSACRCCRISTRPTRVILVDAIRADAAPGSLVRLDGEEVAPAVATRLSPHQIGVADLLDGARWLDRYPRARSMLLGLVPEIDGTGRRLVAATFARRCRSWSNASSMRRATLGFCHSRRTRIRA